MRLSKCKICRGLYKKFSINHKTDKPECALELVKRERAKKERRETRTQLAALKTRSEHLKELQAIFNLFIRERDKGKPCICCDRPMGDDRFGGSVDCGHYRSVGSAPHLRFNENNAHAQRKQCNSYGSGRAVDYRLGLIKKIGLLEVEKLEADQTPKQYTIEEIVALKAVYREKIKAIRILKG